ncbi:MAG: hypothetical protein KatS3mg128_0637 [Silanimonas sp.]|nr:MAG: hypothetical protein KatS3mg128_0637 [Silanimonas sp.]
MAGMPFSLGYAAKTLIKAAKFESEAWAWVSYSSVGVSAIAVAVAGVAAYRVFWHQRSANAFPEIHEAGWAMRWPPIIAASLGILLGLFPDQLTAPLLDPAAPAMRPPGLGDEAGDAFEPSMLGTVGFAVAAGLGLYLAWDRLHDVLERVFAKLEPLSMPTWYARGLAAIPAAAGALTRRVQNGRLDDYLLMTAAACAAGLLLAAWLVSPTLPTGLPLLGEHPGIALGGLLLVVVSLLVLLPRSPLLLLLCSGLSGLASALVFLFAGAPDVALTQFTVEVAFIVVASVLIIRFSRTRRPASTSAPRRALRAAVALASGAARAFALLLALLRLVRGPTPADRVVALDIVFSASLALTAAMALATGRVLFLDIALGLALVGFVATVVWARVVERTGGG